MEIASKRIRRLTLVTDRLQPRRLYKYFTKVNFRSHLTKFGFLVERIGSVQISTPLLLFFVIIIGSSERTQLLGGISKLSVKVNAVFPVVDYSLT